MPIPKPPTVVLTARKPPLYQFTEPVIEETNEPDCTCGTLFIIGAETIHYAECAVIQYRLRH